MKSCSFFIAGLLLLALTPGAAAETAGQDLLLQYGCRGCHRIAGIGGSRGPDLDGIASRLTPGQIRAKLLGRDAGEHRQMPIFDHLSPEERELLVTVLTRMN
jgi:ubiquinol-cytochrome c reductase cytochrome b subunit